MSGGHFYPEYVYYRIEDFVNEVEDAIHKNGKERSKSYYGEQYYPDYGEEVVNYIKSKLPEMRKMAEIMRHIDYLYAADHGPDSFMNRVKEVEEKYSV